MSDDLVIKLAEEHWEYTKGILERLITEGDKENIIELCHFLYISAFAHGWKHKEEQKVET